MSVLIAYYSRAGENYFGGSYRNITVGNTEKVAKTIAAMTGGVLFRIEQSAPYSNDYRTCTEQAKKDLQHNARPALATLPENFEDYDEIYLGYPNYWGTMPMAVYTFLERFDFTGKTIHPFCTHEGSGLSGTVNDIRKVAKGASVSKGLAVCGSYVDKAEPDISKWVHEVQS